MSVSTQVFPKASIVGAVPRAATSMLVRGVSVDAVAGYSESHLRNPTPAEVNRYDVVNVGRIGTLVSFSGGSQLYGEREPADYLYSLVAGVARGYRMTPDGRRQVVAFYVAGDLFGFELGGEHSFSVEAVSDSKVRMIKRTLISLAVARDRGIAEDLVSGITHELRRNQQHVRRLGKTAPERVASFVLELADRLSKDGMVDVPMSRRDIADYLGVTIETVSRTLTQLTNLAAISMYGPRKIAIRNSALLQRFASEAAE